MTTADWTHFWGWILPRLDWKIDAGNLIQIIVLICTIVMGYGYMQSQLSTAQALLSETREEIKTLRSETMNLKADLAEIRGRLNRLR